MWPDGNYGKCCVEHDRAYFEGGTKACRLKADIDLFICVAQKQPINAAVMFIGVRLFGAPFWPISWRWNHGRPYKKSWRYDT